VLSVEGTHAEAAMTSVQSLVDREMLRRRLLIESLIDTPATPHPVSPAGLRTITISRQEGSGGQRLAADIAASLGFELIDRQILELLVANTGVRERLVSSLDERTRSRLELWLEGMMTGRSLGGAEYSRWLARSILALARKGGTVILGRGANFVLGEDSGLHIRVVAPRAVRVRNLMSVAGLTRELAERRVDAVDHERAQFCRHEFGADINDPAWYHLVINTGLVSLEDALDLVLAAWRRRESLVRP
jgi:cytidylate kinase